jgi:hypothetical protein
MMVLNEINCLNKGADLQALLYNAQLEAIHETIDVYSRICEGEKTKQ